MLKDFKAFVMRGNMVDLAVGVIIGGAFGALVTSLVNDIFMPIIGWLVGDTDFSNLYVLLTKLPFTATTEAGEVVVNAKPATLADAQALGMATLNYGNFITGIINFLLMALVVFFMVRAINKVRNIGKKEEAPAAPTTKVCPYCQSEININATKCPHCTSDVE